MPYELIKKIILKNRPNPCEYCDRGWTGSDGKIIPNCFDICKSYINWSLGKIVVPQGYDEIRELKKGEKQNDPS